MSQHTAPAIDRTIYPMPMFATFRVADIAATEAFYQAVGFVSLATIPGPDGSPVVVHLRRMKYQDLLLTPGVYHLDRALRVKHPDTVVLGLGMPSLAPTTGDIESNTLTTKLVSTDPGIRSGGSGRDCGRI